MNLRRHGICLLVVAWLGCDASMPDEPDAATVLCARDADCDDGAFCNGTERCAPDAPAADAAGCVTAGSEPCMASQRCDEAEARCVTDCDADADADGDGRDALECGGDDCDDADPNRFPSNPEVCDVDDHDEDCDPQTFGVRDADGDGFPDARCCNVDGDTRYCGDDCDDARAGVHPTEAESCDGFDNDCDENVDEGVGRTFYPDTDGDGFGDGDAEPAMDCDPPDPSWVENGTDCDDGNRAANPATTEVCETSGEPFDNDCDGAIDEAGTRVFYRDVDEDGFGDPDTVVSLDTCIPPDGYVAAGNDCDDADDAIHPGAPEACDRVDSNCSLPATSWGDPETAEDADGDGHAPVGTTLCTGGPFPADDCDDTSPLAHEGAPEICDGIDDDCDTDVDEEPVATGSCGPHAVCASGVCESRRTVAASLAHFGCGLRAGTVLCWGNDESGELGDGDPREGRGVPAAVDGLTDAVTVAVGGSGPRGHACAVRSGGTVRCWGRNHRGQLGDGSTEDRASPVAVSGLSDAVEVVTGDGHTCARRLSGEIVCWGADDRGQLGNGSGGASLTPASVPLADAVLGLDGVSSVADRLTASGDHTCARVRSGHLLCWGANDDGQLGVGDSTDRLVPTLVPAFTRVREVDAGWDFTCAIDEAARVFCWGDGARGELGSGTATSSMTPVEVTALGSGVASVSAGWNVACARFDGGRIECWGDAGSFTLGTGVLPEPPAGGSAPPAAPTVVADLGDASALDVGDAACAWRASGDIVCWGRSLGGQLGDRGPDRWSPGPLTGTLDQSFSVRQGCAVLGSGEVACWGDGVTRVFGDGFRGLTSVARPIGPTGAIDVSVASSHTCAVLGSGEVHCWGVNGDGQLGDGTTDDAFAPTPVSGLSDAVAVSAARRHTCALRSGGEVACWGAAFGLLPVAIPDRSTGSPTPMDAVAVRAGEELSCALLSDDTVRCWGRGLLGDGLEPPSVRTDDEAVTVVDADGSTPIDDAVSLGVGRAHACVARSDGRVWCWGQGTLGQLGDGRFGSGADALVPAPVDAPAAMTGIVEVSAHDGDHTCARDGAGVVWCWGDDQQGQLGLGSSTASDQWDLPSCPCAEPTPVLVPGLSGASALRAGRHGTCVLRGDGSSGCFGSDDAGQLGRGVLRSVMLP